MRDAVTTAYRWPQAMVSMSTHVARSAISVGIAARASALSRSAGTGSMNVRGSGPVSVMPCSRRSHRV